MQRVTNGKTETGPRPRGALNAKLGSLSSVLLAIRRHCRLLLLLLSGLSFAER